MQCMELLWIYEIRLCSPSVNRRKITVYSYNLKTRRAYIRATFRIEDNDDDDYYLYTIVYARSCLTTRNALL